MKIKQKETTDILTYGNRGHIGIKLGTKHGIKLGTKHVIYQKLAKFM